MTPREIVQMSLAFAYPPRIPFGMGSAGFPSDFRGVHHDPAPNRVQQPWTQRDGYWDMIDMWGNTWRRLESITKGEVYKGVIQDSWDLLDTYEFPILDRAELFEKAAAEVKQYHAEGYYVLGGMSWTFDTARYMRRMEVFLRDCAEEPDRVSYLLNRIADVYERVIERYADIGVDGISTGEDWGTQDRLLVSPPMFRRLFKPVFARLCGVAKSRGLSIHFHSCGFVRDVIGDWIEVGIDSFKFDQPELHGIDWLAKHYGGKMHIWSPVDIQTTLQTRDHVRIEAAAREYIEKLALPFGGGVIAGYYGSNEAIGLTPEYQETASRAFMKYGDPALWTGRPASRTEKA
ncbi:MAG TPA: uroporphyrinogen decarboxylase family protein [Candidatus Latescibacteria bacterium]|nr:uroporphyrinogen decarboxylase family protein [Candidatus Latescibacterota bacterium]HPK75362.1 uroporphyrinogen decarboxylase family protein [Candidatus Latescibacterota bacterium]